MLDKARRYVELSNAHDLDAIEAMLADDAIYVSSNVGAYEGRRAIMAMMRAFFAANPEVSWAVEDYRPVDGGVEFDFDANGRRGTERIMFDAAGFIRRVEVT